MAGHSKWKQIKHKKEISDAKRSATFSKLSKLIAIAARGNQDPATNIHLQGIIERARAANMPKDNIERAISKAKDKEAQLLKEIVVHATGPRGSAFMIYSITDNSNRTIQELKKIFTKYDVKMVADGSLDWMFHELSFTICITPDAFEASPLFEEVLDAGVTDIEQDINHQTILYHPAQQTHTLKDLLESRGVPVIRQETQTIAQNPLSVHDSKDLGKMMTLIEELEDLTDVNDVITNLQNST